jgi:Small Multidrug Resistance protein
MEPFHKGTGDPMAWVILFVAGLFEVGWAIGLKYTEGFTRSWPTIWTALAMVISLWLLGIAMKSLPVGTAYSVWVGGRSGRHRIPRNRAPWRTCAPCSARECWADSRWYRRPQACDTCVATACSGRPCAPPRRGANSLAPRAWMERERAARPRAAGSRTYATKNWSAGPRRRGAGARTRSSSARSSRGVCEAGDTRATMRFSGTPALIGRLEHLGRPRASPVPSPLCGAPPCSAPRSGRSAPLRGGARGRGAG